jgi:shikimate dehydrogenase
VQITGKTKITGLFGYPVSHTLSPSMHNAAFAKMRLNIVYLPFLVNPQDLETAIKSIKIFEFLGVNITVPHKQAVMKYLDEVTLSAELIGAVNTIVYKDKKLIGCNTDGTGFVRSLEKDCNFKLKGKTMFLLGAGGAGRAVAVESALNGLKKIFIADKIDRQVDDLIENVPKKCEAVKIRADKMMRDAISESDIVVNATPVGMHKDDPISIPAEYINSGKIVYDVIYNPSRTKLLKNVKGCKTINGLGMLLYQGVRAFELWTGKKAPVEVMRKALISL